MTIEATAAAEETQVEAPATEAVEQTNGDEGSTPASSVASHSAPVDATKLNESIDALLSKAFHDELNETADEQATEEQPTDEQEVVDGQEEQEAQGAAATPTPVTVTPAAGNAPTLPAAFRRSLIARGYTDQEIDTDLKTQGTRFVEMAERVHRGRSAEIADWANAGRQHKAAQQQQRATPQQTVQPQQPAADGTLARLDIAKLKEQFGDDKLIDTLVGPLNAAIDRVNSVHANVAKVQKSSETAEQETLIRQIDGFFGSKDMESFKGVYGENASFAKDQKAIDARNKVLETADALRVGAELQGRSLTLGEVLTLAHDALSGEYKTQAVRTQVKQQLTQRNRAITLKPGTRVNNPAGFNGSKGKTEQKIGALLTKAFGS